MVDLNMSLSKNFKLWEFTKSPTADRNGISNEPNEEEAANLRRLCEMILQPARDALGPLKITSGFRSQKLNKMVGGVPNSDHRQGFAADVIPVETTTRALAEWVAANVPKFDQIILEFGTDEEPSWIHLSVAPRLRKQILRAVRVKGKTVYHEIELEKPAPAGVHAGNGAAAPAVSGSVLSADERRKLGQQILNWEARRDRDGHLAVYILPAGDGGGRYEVAGINERFHPEKARELKELVEAGRFAEAEEEAIEYIAKQTDAVAGWTSVNGVEAFLRDCCFNRGKGGAARIYQIAVKTSVDGGVGEETMKAARVAEQNPPLLLQSLRAARERYERVWVKRDESSKFWKGLVNRWNNALKFSQSFVPALHDLDSNGGHPGEIKIYSTIEWGARPPRRTNFEQTAAQGIVVHNTADPNRPPLEGEDEKQAAFEKARHIQIDHLRRRDSKSGALWSDTGQNFLISRGGIIMEGRHGSLAAAREGKVVRGAHANNTLHNKTYFGIELEGIYVQKYEMTTAQWNALIELCAHLALWGGFDPKNIKGHKQVTDGSTDCPGLLMDHLNELKTAVERRKNELSGV